MSNPMEDIKTFLGLKEFYEDKFLWKAVLAEFFGTFVLVLVGCSACITWPSTFGDPTVVQIAFAFGLVVATVVQTIGHVSGGHINPAVTFGFLVVRQVSVVKACLYMIAQCVGAIAGAGTLQGLINGTEADGLGITAPNGEVSSGQVFGVELLVTFALVMTVFGVCDENRTDVKGSAPLAIGLTVTACHLAFVPVTGSSMNPARSFGPAVILNSWTCHWAYWIGPLMGGALAAFVYNFVFREKKPQPTSIRISTISRHNDSLN